MRRPRHFSRHTSSAGGQAACGCPWDVDTVLWRRHTVAIARMCVCAPDDGRTAVGRIGFVVGETPRTAAPACARMSPCGQRAAARLVACESCWQHCRGGEAAHGCSCVRAYGAVVEAHSRVCANRVRSWRRASRARPHWRRRSAQRLLRACTPPRTRRRASPAWLRRWDVRAARMPRVEEAQHTPALVHVSMTPRRQHKHTTDRVCACAPGKEQTALVVRARLGIIAVETRQRTAEPVYVHRLRSGSCSGVCPQARSCSHVRRRTW
jgi:hypothetical protein